MIALPVKVLLRCKQVADVTGASELGNDVTPQRVLTGRLASGSMELWFADGKWRESGEPHPLDIVGFINPDGSLRPLTNEFSAP